MFKESSRELFLLFLAIFPHFHVFLLLHFLLLDDPIDYQKNPNDVSSSIVSKASPLGTIKTVLALTSLMCTEGVRGPI